jgi:ubiquitin-activating enzyme E1
VQAQEFYELVLRMNAEAAQATNSGTATYHLDESLIRQHEKLIKYIALCARGQISPMCGLMGGILGQEVLKALSGKFTPIQQWLYMDAFESLPDPPLSAEEVAPIGSRYDGQIMVYGKNIQEKLSNMNMFLVGSGAIGCEILKNWAMMGVSTYQGMTHVTDMDTIEKSNLSRQFLFRNSDISQLKSVSAVKAISEMNPSFHATAYESKVAVETEAFFNDDFFDQLTCVCAALDNVEARLYLGEFFFLCNLLAYHSFSFVLRYDRNQLFIRHILHSLTM